MVYKCKICGGSLDVQSGNSILGNDKTDVEWGKEEEESSKKLC